MVGVIAAGAAVYATTRNDQIGEAARATGSAAISGYNYSSYLCTKYKVMDKIKSAGEATAAKLAEVNEEYKITDRARDLGNRALENIVALDRRHEISRTQNVSTASQGTSPGYIPAARVIRAERLP